MMNTFWQKRILLFTFAIFLFTSCSSKIDQEYNKPALYWYNKLIEKLSTGYIDEADDAFTSLESEHRNSPYVQTSMLILANAHINEEQYTLANFYLDEYIKRYSLGKDIDHVRYLKIKANFLGFKYQYRDQQLIDDTILQISDFKEKYKSSKYMPLVDTIDSRLHMLKSSFDYEISNLYSRRNKVLAKEIYAKKAKESWQDNSEIKPVKVPFYRFLFE